MIKIGSRESKLARVQTAEVASKLSELGYEAEIVYFKTTGDKMLDKPLHDFGGKAVFVTEIEDAMLSGNIDIAVHSAKDMPTELADSLVIAACLKREDPRDVLITLKLADRDSISVIGTSSLRRQVQTNIFVPGKDIKLLRGNVPTRIEKLRRGEYDAIILAAAGIKRLGLDHEDDLRYEYIDTEDSLPAAGQAIIAIESRDSGEAMEAASKLNNDIAMEELLAERKFMEKIEADCHEAVAAHSVISGDEIKMKVMKYLGSECVYYNGTELRENGLDLAERLGQMILDKETDSSSK